MKIKFVKMHGCGNDYIFIDCFDKKIENVNQLSIKLSDRNFGIGGDGIVLILPSKNADAQMRMFNSDGSEGAMCGNAIRCVCKYLFEEKNIQKEILKIETNSGLKEGFLFVKNGKVNAVKINMGKPEFKASLIPANIDKDIILNEIVKFDNFEKKISCVSMGNPHTVIFCDDLKDLEIEKIGREIENSVYFPDRTNVEFVKLIDEKNLQIRVWERGSGETLACGTGACAVFAVCKKLRIVEKDVCVKLKGGTLKISFENENVFMTGDCEKVFEGVVEV